MYIEKITREEAQNIRQYELLTNAIIRHSDDDRWAIDTPDGDYRFDLTAFLMEFINEELDAIHYTYYRNRELDEWDWIEAESRKGIDEWIESVVKC